MTFASTLLEDVGRERTKSMLKRRLVSNDMTTKMGRPTDETFAKQTVARRVPPEARP